MHEDTQAEITNRTIEHHAPPQNFKYGEWGKKKNKTCLNGWKKGEIRRNAEVCSEQGQENVKRTKQKSQRLS